MSYITSVSDPCRLIVTFSFILLVLNVSLFKNIVLLIGLDWLNSRFITPKYKYIETTCLKNYFQHESKFGTLICICAYLCTTKRCKSCASYTVFLENGQSLSFPRQIQKKIMKPISSYSSITIGLQWVPHYANTPESSC